MRSDGPVMISWDFSAAFGDEGSETVESFFDASIDTVVFCAGGEEDWKLLCFSIAVGFAGVCCSSCCCLTLSGEFRVTGKGDAVESACEGVATIGAGDFLRATALIDSACCWFAP